ncbi:MAG: 50S ribosomal protein L18 [Ferruginibacter sp.]
MRYRIRKKVSGTPSKPRLSVFRSNTDIYAQLIDDSNGVTIAAASSKQKDISAQKAPKIEKSKMVGESLAKKATELGIKNVVFDRSGYIYHGRVKAVAEGAREGGLDF